MSNDSSELFMQSAHSSVKRALQMTEQGARMLNEEMDKGEHTCRAKGDKRTRVDTLYIMALAVTRRATNSFRKRTCDTRRNGRPPRL